MLAHEKEQQPEKADKCKPRCDGVDATGPSRRLLFVHRHCRESRECPDYHAQDGQAANPVVVRVLRYLGGGQPYANEAANKAGSRDQVGPACCRLVLDRRAVGVQFWLAVLRLACIKVAALSCHPQFGLIEEGVNLLLVVSRSQAGGRELLAPNLIWSQRWLPYSEERVANSCEEGVNLLLVIAGPQAGGGEFTTSTHSASTVPPTSESGAGLGGQCPALASEDKLTWAAGSAARDS